MYTIHKSDAALQAALELAKGDYQRDVILGSEALSGTTLKGRARQYGAKYKESRNNLLRRLTAAGVPWTEQIGPHNKRILVIG